MSFFVVEAQLTEVGLRPLEIARELGLDAVFMTNNLARYAEVPGFDGVGTSFRVIEADTNDERSVAAAIEDDHSSIDGVFTVCDYNLALVASLCERFGLPGLSSAAATLAANKLLCRGRLQELGVPSPAFVHATTEDELVSGAETVGLPCVVKPMTDSASVGVTLCFSVADASRCYAEITKEPLNARGQRRPCGVLVEQYVLGYEVSVESFYDPAAGRHVVVGVTDKHIAGAPAFAEIADTFPSTLPEVVVASAGATAVQALDAIGHTFGAAHTEVRIAHREPFVIEVNGRIGGGDISELIRLSTGVDVLTTAVGLSCGKAERLPEPTHQGGAAWRAIYPSTGGTLSSVQGLDLARAIDGVVDVQLHVPMGSWVRPLASNHEFIGHVLAEASTAAEAALIADAAASQVVVTVT